MTEPILTTEQALRAAAGFLERLTIYGPDSYDHATTVGDRLRLLEDIHRALTVPPTEAEALVKMAYHILAVYVPEPRVPRADSTVVEWARRAERYR